MALLLFLLFAFVIVLYNLTDFATVRNYLWCGFAVCLINAMIYNLTRHKFEKLIFLRGSWIIMAGVVLVLYHTGFMPAAVFVAAAVFASPFFGASICEGFVGFSLLLFLVEHTSS